MAWRYATLPLFLSPKYTNKSTKRTGKRKPPQRTTTHVVKKGTSKKAKAAAKRADPPAPVPMPAEPSPVDS